MIKKFNEIIKKHSLDSLLGYTFVAFLLITLISAIPQLPSILYDVGQILQRVLGAIIIIGILFAFGCGLGKMITEKKAKSD